MAEPGVVAAVLTVVLGAVPEDVTESISPATSLISRAMRARSWLILEQCKKKFHPFSITDLETSLMMEPVMSVVHLNLCSTFWSNVKQMLPTRGEEQEGQGSPEVLTILMFRILNFFFFFKVNKPQPVWLSG